MKCYKYTTEEFIKRAKEKHGDTYDYDFVEYINSNTKVIITCKKHREFKQNPKNHLNGSCCPKCSGKYNYSTTEFIEKAIEKHGDTYDYSLVDYVNSSTKVKIICKEHGKFEQIPNSHLLGKGCITCSGRYQYTNDDFINKSIETHGYKYNYSKVNYKTNKIKVIIICKEHGEFEQIPKQHMKGHGCPKCNLQTSKPAQQWINYLSVTKPDIQHFYSENGEFSIPNSRYKADGFDEETNTIYEFHGDFWHGNPKIFNSDDFNKVVKATFGELFEKTKQKEEFCYSQGYKYKSVWEFDWNRGVNAVRQIQRKFKIYKNKL
jgi:hypothetical protein